MLRAAKPKKKVRKKSAESTADRTRAGKKKKGVTVKDVPITISPPNIQRAMFTIVGTSTLCLHRFGEKANEAMMAIMTGGKKKGDAREPKDFDLLFQQSRYRDAREGWDGIPCGNIRSAIIAACKLLQFHATKAKVMLFVEAQGVNKDGRDLVRIKKGEARQQIEPMRNTNGNFDLRSRPIWDAGWEADVTVMWDADWFTITDVANLLARAGLQIGIGEGRHSSSKSNGCGWGCFEVKGL